jgi:hypothetical protein
MLTITHIAVWLTLGLGQSGDTPAYVRRGERVEQRFREYRNTLEVFYKTLHRLVETAAPHLVPQLDEAPPEPVLYGYGFLPKLIQDPPGAATKNFASRVYNWRLTEGYVVGEEEKLRRAKVALEGLKQPTERSDLIEMLVREYRNLVSAQKTIDQHIQYNRFWQRTIVGDRPRFDQLTEIYKLLEENSDAETSRWIREVLGKPEVPAFVQILRPEPGRIVFRVPLYTDIQDESYLSEARSAIENFWHANEGETDFLVEIEFRPFRLGVRPERGEHLEMRSHASRFPMDGGVLTTGAETTHAFVGRYIALGPGDLSLRALAHEFGHVLGFRDGYVRGYRDLGDEGVEILEMTSSLDDIMSSPQAGRVQAAHFKLVLDQR